jgi:hypothetical protein
MEILRSAGLPTRGRPLASFDPVRHDGTVGRGRPTHNSQRQSFEHKVWQDEYYDHIIRNERDYFTNLNYLIFNPVEAKLVERPEDYKWLWHTGMSQRYEPWR